MSDIKVHWFDNIHMKIECDSGLAFELAEQFSFFVTGYRFMPAFKIGRWDGKIRLFDLRSRKLFRTLLENLQEFCAENNYSVEVVNPEAFKPKIDWDPTWLSHWAEYGKFQPYPYQMEAISHAFELNNVLILCPTAGGKSYITYLMVRYLLENFEDDILITVPRIGLVEQLFTDFEDYASESGWDVAANCQKISGGADKNTRHRVKISTWQSIYKLDASWFSRFGAYICDEAHEADAKSISSIVDKLPNAVMRVGMTGTIEDTLIHQLELQGRFGPVRRVATTKELMDDGYIAKLEIEVLKLAYSPEDRELVRHMEYPQEIDFLLKHAKRNKLLCNLALRTDNNCIMLFNFIERHGLELRALLEAKAEKYGKKIYYIDGSVEVDIREKVRGICEKVSNAVILASFGTFSTGTNIKNLHYVIFAHPYKAKIKTLQSIGRSLRLHEDKGAAKLYDIADDLVYKSKRGKESLNFAMKHFIERLKVYMREQFTYKIISVDLTT